MALPPRTFCVLLVALFLGTNAVHGLYDKDGPVALLSQRTFSKVLESQVPVVVEFFAPWCGHCKSLAPAFTKAAAKLQGIVPFVAVDCDAEKNRGLCGQFGVQGFPTIKLFSSGKAAPKDYQGERSAKALVDAATGMLTAKHVKRVGSDAEAEAFLEKHSGAPRVLLFSDKAQPSPLYKSLASRFQPKLAFAEVGTGAKDTASRFDVTSRPTLVVVGADEQPQTYQGELKANRLIDFLKKFGSPGGTTPDGEASGEKKKESAKKEGKGGKSKSKGQQQGEEGSKEKDGAGGKDSRVAALPHVVKNVTLGELEGQVLGKEGVGLLAFYSGEDAPCAPVLNQLNQAVHGLSGLAEAAQVHLATPDDVAAAAKQLPPLDAATLAAAEGKCPMQVFLLPFDEKEDTEEWKKFEGELSTKELQKPLMQLFPATFVSGLSGPGAEAFVMEDPGRVKVLLFSDKPDVPPLFRALAANFRQYRMDFAMVSASDQALMRQFNVPKVPHVLVLAVRPEEGAGAPPPTPDGKGKHLPIAMQPYQGPLRYPHLSTFLKVAAFQLGAAPQEVIDELLAASGQQPPAAAAAAAAAVPQLSSQADLQAACLDKGGVCILALLPPQPAEQQQAQQAQQEEQDKGEGAPPSSSSPELTTLRHVAQQRALAAGDAALPLHFAWVDAAKFRAFARALGVAEPGEAPAVVALAPKKRRYAVMSGPLLPDVLDRFVSGLLSGQVTTAPLQGIPELVEQQGEEEEAAAAEPVEEEFDLADIMNEEVAGDVGHTAQERIAAAEAAEAERRKQQAAQEAEAAVKEGSGGKKKGSKKKGSKKKKKAAKASKDEL